MTEADTVSTRSLNTGVGVDDWQDLHLTTTVYEKMFTKEDKKLLRSCFPREQLENIRVGKIIDVVNNLKPEVAAEFEGVENIPKMLENRSITYLKEKERANAERGDRIREARRRSAQKKIQLVDDSTEEKQPPRRRRSKAS